MPLSINTNLFALNAQRNLNKTQAPLTTAMQRLSSTLRINSAKDDAAGLAIATRMTRQVNGLSVAMRNANDGISIAQTAEGAMDEMMYALQRMYELANQAASYNNSIDRASMNQEVNQLIDELGRIVNQTRYNEAKLLAGGFSADIQVGTEVNETINISISNISPTHIGVASSYSAINALSNTDFAVRARVAFATALDDTATINGVRVGSGVGVNSNSINKMNVINSQTASHGVTAFSYGNAAVGTANAANRNATANGDIVINGISIDGTVGGTVAQVVAAINAKTGEHGVVADGAAGPGSRLVLFNKTGAGITVTINTTNAADITRFASGTTSVGAGENGLIVLNQRLNNTAVDYNAAATGEALTGVSVTSTTLSNAPVNAQVITTAASANLGILAFKAGMDTINGDRAILGAKLNRFESTIRNLDNVRENISAAKSRIMDADFAVETSNLTKALIMQQAGISVLAQANTLPQNVLALLQR